MTAIVAEMLSSDCAGNRCISKVRYNRIGTRFSGTTSKDNDCHRDTPFGLRMESVLSRWQTVSRWSLPTRYHHLEDPQIPRRYCVCNPVYNRCISMVHYDPIVSSSRDITLESYECHGGVTSRYCNDENTSERADSEEIQIGEKEIRLFRS
jgi:hypothetical protein